LRQVFGHLEQSPVPLAGEGCRPVAASLRAARYRRTLVFL
jgi:hypothetical protein